MKLFIYLRAFLATLIFPFTVIVLGPAAMILHFIFKSKKIDDKMNQYWGQVCCFISNVKVSVVGLENIPKEGCLFLFNHSSFFDVFALTGFIPGLRFGAKAELFKIPIFSHTMRAMGTLPISRNNRDEVYKIYEEAKSRFHNGEKFALSPEGGRFYGKNLSPFKAGPFIFAISAEAPLVPVVITGAYEVLPKGGFLFNTKSWKSHIKLEIRKPIATKNFTIDNRKDLQQKVYADMNPIWNQDYLVKKTEN